MKSENTIMNNLFRYGGGLAALFFLMSTKSLAQAKAEDEKQTMHVQFLTEQDGFLVFRTVINPAVEKKAVLKITDAAESLLYSEVIRKPDYTRIFKFPKQHDGEIQFLLTEGKETVRKSFLISAKTEEVYAVKEKN